MRRGPQQPNDVSWPQQPSRSGTREPQQPSAALWRQQSRLEKDKVLLQAARAAAARRRLVVAAAQQDAPRTPSSRKQHPPPRVEVSNAYWTRCLNHQYEDALAAPIPPRLATLITQLDKAAA
jgi:hypothetical protein